MEQLNGNIQTFNSRANGIDTTDLQGEDLSNILDADESKSPSRDQQQDSFQEPAPEPELIPLTRDEKLQRLNLIAKLRRYFASTSFKDLLIEYVPIGKLEDLTTPELNELIENVRIVVRTRGDTKLSLSAFRLGLQAVESAGIKAGFNLHGLSQSMVNDAEVQTLVEELSIEYSNLFPAHPGYKLALIGLLKCQNLHYTNSMILATSEKLNKSKGR